MTALLGPVLNSDEAAKYCGFRGGGQTMRDLKQKQAGPAWSRLGKILVYYPSDLDAWIAARLGSKKLGAVIPHEDKKVLNPVPNFQDISDGQIAS
ncbi:hypothetical protein E3T43_07535 [Cryobacterium sp. Hh7]|uniref:hypothetical protein n=1 Tax=Cryobacterium sp. Hh7 TaxID=1259159 RepID=UPI001069D32A|nr:hypothetical protein [Cryobacterium sp. Hh7]TFD58089.1 hypothetical protein E3T43_07535 [Cryobacterium sp. Hh7]